MGNVSQVRLKREAGVPSLPWLLVLSTSFGTCRAVEQLTAYQDARDTVVANLKSLGQEGEGGEK